MTTTIILIRHCVHALIDRVLVGRQPNVFLSEAGVEQARRLAVTLTDRGIASVKSSPQPRARQTAETIAARLGKPIEIRPEFDEVDFGAWSGRSFNSLRNDPRWKRWNSEREACRPPGGESLRELQCRVLAGLGRLAAVHPGDCIAVVTHAEPARAAIMHYRGISLREFARVRIDPGSCTTLQLRDGGSAIVRDNEHAGAMMVAT